MIKKRTIGLVIIVAMVTIVAGLAPPAQKTQAFSYDGTMSIDCDGFVADNDSAWLDRNNAGTLEIPEEHFILIAWDGAGTIIFYQDSQANLGERVNGIGVASWTTPPQYNPITFQAISAAGNELPEEIGFEATGSCDGLPTFGAIAGCEAALPLTTDSVVGAFVTDADLYWSPGKLTDPIATITAGNTAWVLGVDSTGSYYKIVWVCQLLWVPVSTMGPNFDKVWNGSPLPTAVVS